MRACFFAFECECLGMDVPRSYGRRSSCVVFRDDVEQLVLNRKDPHPIQAGDVASSPQQCVFSQGKRDIPGAQAAFTDSVENERERPRGQEVVRQERADDQRLLSACYPLAQERVDGVEGFASSGEAADEEERVDKGERT